MNRITPGLWFDDNAEEVVAFYLSGVAYGGFKSLVALVLPLPGRRLKPGGKNLGRHVLHAPSRSL